VDVGWHDKLEQLLADCEKKYRTPKDKDPGAKNAKLAISKDSRTQ